MAEKTNRKNLVVLAYANNNCYVTALSLGEYLKKDPSLNLNLEHGSWLNRSFNTTPFGKCRSPYYQKGLGINHPCREGIIGIYDRTKLQHLNAMVHHATEATSSRCACMEVD